MSGGGNSVSDHQVVSSNETESMKELSALNPGRIDNSALFKPSNNTIKSEPHQVSLLTSSFTENKMSEVLKVSPVIIGFPRFYRFLVVSPEDSEDLPSKN